MDDEKPHLAKTDPAGPATAVSGGLACGIAIESGDIKRIPPRLLDPEAHCEWVRLRTLMLLRWLSIAGQLVVILAAHFLLGLGISLELSLLVVAVSALVNLGAGLIFSPNARLPEYGTLAFLVFDLLQLAALLGLNGGLTNPFALLMLAPVVVAATALHLAPTLFLGALAILATIFLRYVHLPVMLPDGSPLLLPDLFLDGFLAAIVIGIVFTGAYARRVTVEAHAMGQALLAAQLALAREQMLSDLAGVVAATAHELGTPLATIKLVSSELAEELADRKELREDAELIAQQAERCRDILHSMGKAGKADLMIRHVPLEELLRQAAEPHAERGKEVIFDVAPLPGGEKRQPLVRRDPQIIHGLRNFIQNAVDFARSTVWVEGYWDDKVLRVRISDDGPGYPADVLGRIGDPFMSYAPAYKADDTRPGYEGMGLGIFIAKNLLERSGATLVFANGRDFDDGHHRKRGGAVIEITWPLEAIVDVENASRAPLGENINLRTET